MPIDPFPSISGLQAALQAQRYIADRSLAISIFLALKLGKPLFLEGEAGVGKTEVAKVLAAVLGRPLIRLQCYEGLDINTAVYEWNYARQMLHIRLLEASGQAQTTTLSDLFGPDFLLKRPLLQAIDGAGNEMRGDSASAARSASNGPASSASNGPASSASNGPAPVLLIDELDRADEEFEAFLLEILSDFQITIPEIGSIRAVTPPVVVVTSNRTREIHDALKRRCIYHWIDYPTFERECEIVLARVPEAPQHLTAAIVAFVQRLRDEDLYKKPGVAETLDWAHALLALDQASLGEDIIHDTLGVLLKYQDDIAYVRGGRVAHLLNTQPR